MCRHRQFKSRISAIDEFRPRIVALCWTDRDAPCERRVSPHLVIAAIGSATMQLEHAYRYSIVAVIVSAMIALGSGRAWALTRACGVDAVANTDVVLCAPPSGPCTATSVVM